MILHIDTTNRAELLIQLINDEKVIAEVRDTQSTNHAQQLLPHIDAMLQKNTIELKDLTEISVNAGPGSFTGTRVGVATANALGWALGIPVNGAPAGQTMPVYDRAPNISTPKQA